MFIIFGLFFVLIAWYGFILSLFSILYTGLFYKGLLIFGIVLIAYILLRTRKKYNIFEKPSNVDIISTIFVIAFAIFNCVFAHDTFYGGRDQGLYSTYSIYLANIHTLDFNSPINALIPEFLTPGAYFIHSNSTIIPHFHLGYISWLATNYGLFGLTGIKFSNFIPLLILLISIYLIGKNIINGPVGFVAILTFATTFPMLWFTRQTVSEIFSMALIWFGVLCVLNIWNGKKDLCVIGAILSFGLLSFVRVEGVAFFGLLLVILFLFNIVKKNELKTHKKIYLLIFMIVLLIIYYNLYVQPRYIPLIYSGISNFFSDSSSQIAVQNAVEVSKSAIRYHFTDFIYLALSEYNLQIGIIFILLIFIKCIINITGNSKKILLVLFFMLPAYPYLIVPFITLDQPWFLRRYILTILPSAYLFLSIFLYSMSKNKQVFVTAISLVLLLNILTVAPIMFFSENEGMLDNVEEISKEISNEDLILVDRYATGSYKMADPLFFIFERPALWWDDNSLNYLKQNMTVNSFNDIYILTNDQNDLSKYFNSEELELVYEKNITFNQLERTVDLNHYPHTVDDIYDMDYSIAQKLMHRPSEIISNKYKIKMYKVCKNTNINQK